MRCQRVPGRDAWNVSPVRLIKKEGRVVGNVDGCIRPTTSFNKSSSGPEPSEDSYRPRKGIHNNDREKAFSSHIHMRIGLGYERPLGYYVPGRLRGRPFMATGSW